MMGKTAQTIAALQKRGIPARLVETPEELLKIVENEFLKPGCKVALGGTVTADETSLFKLIEEGDYQFFNRYVPGLTPEEKDDVMRQAFSADCYFASANAITADGKLLFVDGAGNRVAAISFGPKKVVIVAGENKIVDGYEDAVARVRDVAGPKNCQRLGVELQKIWCDVLTVERQLKPGRLEVLLLKGDWGY